MRRIHFKPAPALKIAITLSALEAARMVYVRVGTPT
jgi:hypothetical protein